MRANLCMACNVMGFVLSSPSTYVCMYVNFVNLLDIVNEILCQFAGPFLYME